ncbi:MAG: S41 family peptidase [bacterium]
MAQPPKPQKRILFFLGVLLLFGSFVFGYLLGLHGEPGGISSLFRTPKTSSVSTDFSLLDNVWDVVQHNYVSQPVDATAATYGAIRGLLSTLKDPYTIFFTPGESKDFQEEIQGTFEGIGAEIGMKNNLLVIIAPLSGSPAERVGLLAGDRILAIDGAGTAEMTVDEAVQKIRGQKGTTVVLSVQKPTENVPREVKIVRESITVKSVTMRNLEDGIVAITISYFGPETARDFLSVSNEAVVKNAKGIILDLRNNPGGYLDAAVSVTAQFVQEGTTVVFEEGSDHARSAMKTEGGGTLLGIPAVVLIDQGSASGAEIVAGALQDLQAATLVGTTSFGKGSVQEVKELPGGASMKVTVAKWLTPNGRSIQDHGISPDIVVERTEDDYNHDRDPQLDQAIRTVKEHFTGAQ